MIFQIPFIFYSLYIGSTPPSKSAFVLAYYEFEFVEIETELTFVFKLVIILFFLKVVSNKIFIVAVAGINILGKCISI